MPRPRPREPSSPATATTSPTRAPLRSTGARPSSEPSAVTAIVSVSETVRSPPSTAHPGRERVARGAQAVGEPARRTTARVSSGIASATSSAVGRAPIAAMSARFTAAAFQPRSNAARPCEAEVGAVHERVDRRDHAPIGGGEHGGVVARPDRARPTRPSRSRIRRRIAPSLTARPPSGRRRAWSPVHASAAAARGAAGSLEGCPAEPPPSPSRSPLCGLRRCSTRLHLDRRPRAGRGRQRSRVRRGHRAPARRRSTARRAAGPTRRRPARGATRQPSSSRAASSRPDRRRSPARRVNGVDWIIDDSEAPRYRVTTFGRTPAVELYLDNDVVSSAEVLDRLSRIVGVLPADGSACTERRRLPTRLAARRARARCR